MTSPTESPERRMLRELLNTYREYSRKQRTSCGDVLQEARDRFLDAEMEADAILAQLEGLNNAEDEFRKWWKRYEYLRRLTPRTFTDLWRKSLTDGNFDDLVDAAIRGADKTASDKEQG
jgi:hypothetical protein